MATYDYETTTSLWDTPPTRPRKSTASPTRVAMELKRLAAKQREQEAEEEKADSIDRRIFEEKYRMPKPKELPKGHQVCPMCERISVVKKIHWPQIYDVRGHMIEVKEQAWQCERCGEKWKNTMDGYDGRAVAYCIYTKRKYPAARKFKRVYFEGGTPWAPICKSCESEYGLGGKCGGMTNTMQCACKGCKNDAKRRVVIGRI